MKSCDVPLKSLSQVSKSAVKPKKKLSAFMYFNKEYGPLVRKANPDVNDIGQIMKVVSQKWNELSITDKKKYEDL